MLPPGCVSGASQKRSRDGPSAAPGLTHKVSPVRTPLPQPALRFGVITGLSSHVSAIFHVSPTGGGHRHWLLGKWKERGSPSPAEPTACAFTSTTDGRSRYLFLSACGVFFASPLSFLFSHQVLKTEHVKAHSLLKNAIGDSCEAPKHLEGCFLALFGVETRHSSAAAPASASLRGRTLLCPWL